MQFDVYRLEEGYALDCQSDLHSALATRFVVPLDATTGSDRIKQRLNPAFEVDGQRVIMMTEFALAISKRDLGERIGSLAEYRYEILGALDVILTGV